jgi:hypothetical protein
VRFWPSGETFRRRIRCKFWLPAERYAFLQYGSRKLLTFIILRKDMPFCRIIHEESKLSADFTAEKPALMENSSQKVLSFRENTPQHAFPLYNLRKFWLFAEVKLRAGISPWICKKISNYFLTFIKGLLAVDNEKTRPKNSCYNPFKATDSLKKKFFLFGVSL